MDIEDTWNEAQKCLHGPRDRRKPGKEMAIIAASHGYATVGAISERAMR